MRFGRTCAVRPMKKGFAYWGDTNLGFKDTGLIRGFRPAEDGPPEQKLQQEQQDVTLGLACT